MRVKAARLLVVVVLIAACGKGSETEPQKDESAPTQPPYATLSPIYLHLQRDYETLHDAHEAISDVWESLADNKQVACGQISSLPDPDGISAEGEAAYEVLAALLRDAAIDINEAGHLWQAECARPGQQPSPETISQGLLSVRAAGDSLNEASRLLAGS